jgi:RHS repeat-associated protein
MTRRYNVAGQLVQQVEKDNHGELISQFDFSYDAAGNILKEQKLPKPESVSLPPVTMTYSVANRLATYNGQAVNFDADGNMVSGPLSGEMANFRFDSRNRLVSAGETSYRYDAENQRLGVNQTSYVINSQPALSQVLVKEENGTKTFYVYGLGLIGEEKEGEYRAYHFDYRGSTVALTDQTGKVVERFQYGPYGELVKGEASVTPFLFNGKFGVMTDSSGLYYMRARFYSAVMKRFVNMDVLVGRVSQGQTLNRYTYVTGRPVSYIDPFGLLEMRDEYGEPTASNDDIMPDVEDVKWLLAISSFFTPGPGELLDIDVLFGITQSSTGWEKLGATSSLVLSVLTVGESPNYGGYLKCSEHVSIWKAPQRGKGQRQLEHGYSPTDFCEGDRCAYFAKERNLAEEYARHYGEGVIEIRVPKDIYEARIKQYEYPYQGGSHTELAIPHSEFEVLNNSTRELHK